MGCFCQYMGIGHWTCAIPPHCQSLSCLYLYICVFVYLCICLFQHHHHHHHHHISEYSVRFGLCLFQHHHHHISEYSIYFGLVCFQNRTRPLARPTGNIFVVEILQNKGSSFEILQNKGSFWRQTRKQRNEAKSDSQKKT